MNLGTLPPVLVDIPWLLLTAVLLPLAVWWLRAARERQRRARLARYAESSALHRLVMITDPDEGGRTVRLMLVVGLAGLALAGPALVPALVPEFLLESAPVCVLYVRLKSKLRPYLRRLSRNISSEKNKT